MDAGHLAQAEKHLLEFLTGAKKVISHAEQVQTAMNLAEAAATAIPHPTGGRWLPTNAKVPPVAASVPEAPAAPTSNVRMTGKQQPRDTVLTDFFQVTKKRKPNTASARSQPYPTERAAATDV